MSCKLLKSCCKAAFAAGLLSVALPGSALGQLAPATLPAGPDERLWRTIVAELPEPAPARPDLIDFDAAIARRTEQLQRVQTYLRLYPGGARRDRCARLERSLLLEIACLRGGEFDALAEVCVEPVGPQAGVSLAEAIAWRRLLMPRSPDEPAPPLRVRDLPEPRSRVEAPATAAAAIDMPAAPELLELVKAAGGGTGGPVVLLISGGGMERARPMVTAIQQRLQRRPELRAAWISFDPTLTFAQENAAALGISNWPLRHEPRGFATPWVQQLRVRALPVVLEIDRDGRIRAINAAGEPSASAPRADAP